MGTSKKASISKTRKPLRQLALRAAVNGHWREKRQCLSPAPISVHRKSAKNGQKCLGLSLPACAPARAHSGLRGQTRGVSALCEVDRGMIQQAGGNGCARLQRASASSGVAAPLGCVICLQLGDVAVFSLCAQYFLNVRGGGGITTPGVLCVLPKRRTSACQSGSFVVFCGRTAIIDSSGVKFDPTHNLAKFKIILTFRMGVIY